MWWNVLVGPLATIIDKILDGVLPKEMAEKEREEIKLKMQAQFYQQMQAEREDMKNAREMAMKELDSDVWIVRLLRGLLRPLTGFLFVGFYIWSKVCIHFGMNPIVLGQDDYVIIGGILGFYFGLRSFYDKRNGKG
jgi:hypothetical protein